MRPPPLLPLLLALGAGLSPGCGDAPREGQPVATQGGGRDRPDVLVILLDDLSERDLGVEVEMPFLEGLGERGLHFRRAYAYPSCSPSRYALCFGRHPYRGGVGGVLRIGDGAGADLSAPSLAEAFRSAGYRTALVGKWHLAASRNATEIARGVRACGFETWRAGICYGAESYYDWRRVEDDVLSEETEYVTGVQTESFLSWWGATEGPRFCLLAYQALHTPYEEPPSGRHGYERSSKGNWQAMGRDLDDELRRVLAAVDLEHTVVLILGDNGTAPGVGVYERGHTKPTAYEGGIHVPLVAVGYGVEARGDTSALVSVVDLAATLVDLAGIEPPPGAFQDSRSFRTTLETGGPARTLLYTQRYKPDGFGPRELEEEAALAADGRKLLRFLDGHEEAYDVLADPFEERPLDLDDPGLAPLRALLDELGG